MYNKIFLPTDGSEHAEVALEHAIDLAQKYDAQLHVLYVVDVRANSGFNMWPDMLEELQAVGKEVTQEIADKAEKSGIEVITEVKQVFHTRRSIPILEKRHRSNYYGNQGVKPVWTGFYLVV